MNDQWLAALARRADVRTKAVTLPIERLLQAEVIESRFADGNHLRVVGQGDEAVDRWLLAILRVGMHSDGGDDVTVLLGYGQHSGKLL